MIKNAKNIMQIANNQQIMMLYLSKNIIFATNCIDKVSSNRKKNKKHKKKRK